jgi:RHS repeat-associated protein
VVNTITYDAWGNLSQTGSGSNDVGRYAWTGRERDVETGLQYNRARYYDPNTGRWMTQDPIGFDAGDSNLYRYVRSAPTNSTDPSGFTFTSGGLVAVKHLDGTIYGYVRPGFEVLAFPVQDPVTKKWKLEMLDFVVSAGGKYRTYFYDEWKKDEKGQFVGTEEFKRTKEDIQRTIDHEQMHINNWRAWHDNNKDAIQKDFNTDFEFKTKADAEAAFEDRHKKWKMKFDTQNELESTHKTPGWKGYEGSPRERKPPLKTGAVFEPSQLVGVSC